MTKHNIAMVCDYFYPSLGGIETHIELLSKKLVEKGHKVIIITHKYMFGDQKIKGVRYLEVEQNNSNQLNYFDEDKNNYYEKILKQSANMEIKSFYDCENYKNLEKSENFTCYKKSKKRKIKSKSNNVEKKTDLIIKENKWKFQNLNNKNDTTTNSKNKVEIENGIVKFCDSKISKCQKIKIFYLDIPVVSTNTSFPSIFSYFPLLYKIFKQEKIQIVHGHQTMSNLCLESIFHGRTMGLKTILTEHSLFEVGGFENILVNRLAGFVLRGIDRFVCVSYTCKQNLIDRLGVDSDLVYVVGNAVVTKKFFPKDLDKRLKNSKKIDKCKAIKKAKNVRKEKLRIEINEFQYNDKIKDTFFIDGGILREIKVNKTKEEFIFEKTNAIKNIEIEYLNSDTTKKKEKVKITKSWNFKGRKYSLNQNEIDNCTNRKNYLKNFEIQKKSNTLINKTDSNNMKDKNITIILLSRLVSRKGIDIFINILPKICHLEKNITVLIGGNGPKIHEIEQTIDEHDLYNQVKLLGEVDHSDVPEILRKGDIFLNTSLTEAFCMAILEAASCGLQVVSTNVGGIHEVLPEEIAILTGISEKEILEGIKEAIKKVKCDKIDKLSYYNMCRSSYDWGNVTDEIVKIYDGILMNKETLEERVGRYHPIYELVFIMLVVYEHILYNFLVYFYG